MSSIWSEETSPEGITCVDLVDGDIAALLGGLDHLLDAGIGEIEKRQRLIGRAFFLFRGFFFFFCLRRLRLFAIPPLLTVKAIPWPDFFYWRVAPRFDGQKGPRRHGVAPNQVPSLVGTR